MGYSHFFYGSSTDTLDKMKNMLEERYPGIKIAGMYAPPFRALTDKEDLENIDMIKKADSDFIWVGLGAPKQEQWMYAHNGMFNGVMVGVGAAFDYAAGNIKRAPMIMQKLSLEWLYRLLQDPKRLWKRYVTTNFKFIIYIMKESRKKHG
jgi:N-acetylglucosaminyldiphosphoundecaprenol N-acetyl-beta-D-mannosaminyltransferase